MRRPDESGIAGDASALDSIRARTLCGRCKAATFLVWEAESVAQVGIDKEAIHRREERRGMSRVALGPGTAERTFVVRCSFFKMNVPDPMRITACEAFRDHDRRTRDE